MAEINAKKFVATDGTSIRTSVKTATLRTETGKVILFIYCRCSSTCFIEAGWTCYGGDWKNHTVDSCFKSNYITGTTTECRATADLFFNTCDQVDSDGYLVAASSIATMTAQTETCDGGFGSCIGATNLNGVCTWSRKLCVTC